MLLLSASSMTGTAHAETPLQKDTVERDALVDYYDSDFPWVDDTRPSECEDGGTSDRLACLRFYRDLASSAGGEVLELCCGTGRIAVPLARAGVQITGIDNSSGMLDGFRRHLQEENVATRARITLVQADIRELALEKRDFSLAIIPFSSLMLVDSLEGQRLAIQCVARHLAHGGLLALDLINPFVLPLGGTKSAEPLESRVNIRTGNEYVQYSQASRMDASGRQHVIGWYSERAMDGSLSERPFSLWWRPIFPWEIAGMLGEAGFTVISYHGDFGTEAYSVASRYLYVVAERTGGGSEQPTGT